MLITERRERFKSRCDDINNGQESESLVGLDRVINANAGRGEIVSTLGH